MCSLEEAWNLQNEPKMVPWETPDSIGLMNINNKLINTNTEDTNTEENTVDQEAINEKKQDTDDNYKIISKSNEGFEDYQLRLSKEEELYNKLIPLLNELTIITEFIKKNSFHMNYIIAFIFIFTLIVVGDIGFRYGQWYTLKKLSK